MGGRRVLWAAVVALAALPAAAGARVRTGPGGPSFYRPPVTLVRTGATGTALWQRPATPLVARPRAGRTVVFAYRSVSVRGRRVAMTASLATPRGAAPSGGWPTVVFSHVTTGAADACAPSAVTADNTERERMTRSDAFTDRLLDHGVAVVRVDDEGIGTRGAHPYLIGESLARAIVDGMRGARTLDRRLGRRWAIAGHSEGGVGALFAAGAAPRLAPDLDMRAVTSFAPPTHIRDLLQALSVVPVALGPVTSGLSALAGLILGGAAVAEPSLWALYRDGGLSPAALRLLPDLERRCLNDLSAADSWGGLAPSQIPGPNAARAEEVLFRVVDANDPKHAPLPRVPVLLGQGMLDAVVPFPFTEELADDLRRRGADVDLRRFPAATHVTITDLDQAGGPAADWLVAKLR